MERSSSQQAENIMNAEFTKHGTFNHNLAANVNIVYCPAPMSTILLLNKELGPLNRLFTEHQLQGLDKLTMKKKWKELTGMLGYLPLGLQVTTSDIHERYKYNSDLRTVLADYVKQLRNGADRLSNDPLLECTNLSVYASMLPTFKQLENMTDHVP